MGDKNHLLYVVTIHAIFALLHFIVSDAVETLARAVGRQERWQLLRNNTGVVAMHMALTHENTVIIFDQTEAGPSQYRLHERYNGRRCSTRSRADLKDGACYAHSVEYYIHGNNLRPLRFVSDPWCSSGSFLSNGTLLQVGGHGRGSQRIRYFRPCRDHLCNWQQSKRSLSDNRWGWFQKLSELRIISYSPIGSPRQVPKSRSHGMRRRGLGSLRSGSQREIPPCIELLWENGHILIINGARRGCAGWQNAATPSLRPYLYNPKKSRGQRFTVLKATRIARMYHSSALLLPDGRVLVAGGNPYNTYTFSNVAYPTELRLQAFVPDYMDRQFNDLRPGNVTIEYEGHSSGVAYGTAFTIHFWLGRRPSKDVEYSVYAPPFTTHSISMNQRLLKLRCRHKTRDGGGSMSAVLEAPPSPNVAPPGYYLLTVVNNGIPSLSQWIRFIPA
ncbi:hypothetical protein V6Z11_D12G211400 [Gossypium hirsutum]